MLYALLAKFVLVVHLGFVVFVVFGGLLALRWPRAAWGHLPAAIWGAWVELGGKICPLTPLENRLLQAAGEEGYAGGFVERYLISTLYPGGLTRGDQAVLGLLVVGVNIAVYGFLVARWRRGETRR